MSSFTVKSSGSNTETINDWYDLDEIFKEDFFPKEIDFSNLFSFEGEQMNNYDMDMDDILSVGTGQNSSMVPLKLGNSNRVILIPPLMPRTSAPQLSSTSTNPQQTPAIAETKSGKRKTGAASSAAVTGGGSKKKPDGRSSSAAGARAAAALQQELEEYGDEDDLDDMDPANMTEGQRIERRDRNREHAKRSRIRKRVLLDTLQGQLAELRSQNIKLRRAVVDRLPGDLAAHILTECTTEESTLLASLNATSSDGSDDGGDDGAGRRGDSAARSSRPSALTANIASSVVQRGGRDGSGKDIQKVLMEPDYRLIHSLITSQQNFVLSDPSLPDNPIVYASDGFCRLSGYRRQDVLGRNCRFLQGPGTDQAAVDVIRQGVADGRDVSVCLLNYRADGSPFWNQFFLGALKDADGQVVNYVGVQCEVNTVPINEMKDRVKKLHLPDA